MYANHTSIQQYDPNLYINIRENYYTRLAGSYSKNKLGISNISNISNIEAIIKAKESNLKYLYRFKKHSLVPRIQFIINIVKNLGVNSILDAGSQRGALLFPLIHALKKGVDITSFDIDLNAVEFLKLTSTDIDNFNVMQADIYNLTSVSDNTYECVICSEILEHLHEPSAAAKELLRVSSKYIICSVPGLPDNNEEHIQLFYENRPHKYNHITRSIQHKQTNLKKLWLDVGATSCRIKIINKPPYSVLIAVINK